MHEVQCFYPNVNHENGNRKNLWPFNSLACALRACLTSAEFSAPRDEPLVPLPGAPCRGGRVGVRSLAPLSFPPP